MLGGGKFIAYRPTLAEERAFQSKLTAFTRESQQLSAEERGGRQKTGRKARRKSAKQGLGRGPGGPWGQTPICSEDY